MFISQLSRTRTVSSTWGSGKEKEEEEDEKRGRMDAVIVMVDCTRASTLDHATQLIHSPLLSSLYIKQRLILVCTKGK